MLYRKLLIAVPLASLLAVGNPLAAVATTAPASATASSSLSAQQQSAIATILTDINKQRTANNLPLLTVDQQMADGAVATATANAAAKKAAGASNFSSLIPAGSISQGQLMASGFSPTTITNAWMGSVNSKAQITNINHTHIGVGIAYDSAGKAYYNVFLAGYPAAEDPDLSEVSVSKPDGITATAVNANRIDLTWNPVTYTGVLSPYKVMVTANTGGTTVHHTTASELSLTGLNPSTNYSITIEASATSKNGSFTRTISGNIVRWTPAGDPPAPTPTPEPTPTTPAPTPTPTLTPPTTTDPTVVQVGAPASIKTSKKSTTSMTVLWAPPTVLQGKITKYTVQVSGSGYSKSFTAAADATEQAFTGLTANTSYTVVVTAHASSLDGKSTRSAKRTTTISTVKVLTQADVDRIIADTNAYRAQAGLPALKQHTGLNTLAASWSKTQADEKRRYHNGNLRTQTPAGWSSIGENVANGFTVETVTKAWFESEGHRANMLNPRFTHIGVGLAYDDNGMLYYTQNFAEYK